MAQLLPYYHANVLEAGCDEAGRGCLAGPVVAAAVILPEGFNHPWLNDSKQLTEHQRNTLRPIIESAAQSWAIGIVSNEEIDQINILNASFLAMHRALDQLTLSPAHILVDGNRFKRYKQVPHTCIVKGDGKMMSIAAASILAKTWRDEMMVQLHEKLPEYGWLQNKGYPTTAHRNALKQYGLTPYHRRSFRLFDDQLSLF